MQAFGVGVAREQRLDVVERGCGGELRDDVAEVGKGVPSEIPRGEVGQTGGFPAFVVEACPSSIAIVRGATRLPRVSAERERSGMTR